MSAEYKVWGPHTAARRAPIGSGNGPVDAVFSCISKVVGFSPKLKLYNINAITPDSDAQGEVAVKLEHFFRPKMGNGV